MASRYYGIDRGDNYVKVVESSSTTGKDVEVVVDLASNIQRAEVLVKIDELKEYILSDQWPPA